LDMLEGYDSEPKSGNKEVGTEEEVAKARK
jgi:hypothetical protein